MSSTMGRKESVGNIGRFQISNKVKDFLFKKNQETRIKKQE
jgi:hypothetical protein